LQLREKQSFVPFGSPEISLPDNPKKTLSLAWQPDSSRGAEGSRCPRHTLCAARDAQRDGWNADERHPLGYPTGFIAMVTHAIGANTFVMVRIMERFSLLTALVGTLPDLAEGSALTIHCASRHVGRRAYR
jgi:hypothetical protein